MKTQREPLSVKEIRRQTILLVLDFPLGTEVIVEESPDMRTEGIVDGYTIYPSIKNRCVGLRVQVPGDVLVMPPQRVKRKDSSHIVEAKLTELGHQVLEELLEQYPPGPERDRLVDGEWVDDEPSPDNVGQPTSAVSESKEQ